MAFNTNILIKFNDITYKALFLNKIKGIKFKEIIQIFHGLEKKKFIQLKGNEGIAYNIDLDEEIKKIFKKYKNNLLKNKSQTSVFPNIDLIVNNFNNLKKGQKESDKNLDEENEEKAKEITKKENGEEENKEDDIKLSSFDEEQIKALIKYYFFITTIEKDVTYGSSRKNNFNLYECCLINSNWMQNYRKFYLYDELVDIIEQIQKEIKQNIDKELTEENVFINLPSIYIKKIKEKESLYTNENFETQEKIEYSFNKLDNETYYPTNFEIISAEIFDLLKQRKNKTFKLTKRSFIVNSHQIIIEYKKKNKNNPLFELLIGNIDFSSYKFISEKVLKYNDEKNFITHYHLLKSLKYKSFLNKKIKDEKKEIMELKESVGKIYQINEKQQNEIITDNTETNSIKSDTEYANKLNINQNTNNIKFLFKLYFFIKKLRYELNNNSENYDLQECYLIKKELIDKYKEYYNFDDSIKNYEKQIFKKLNNVNLAFSEGEEKEKFYDSLIKHYEQKYINNNNYEFNFESEMNKNLFNAKPSQQYINEQIFFYYENYIISGEPISESQKDKKFIYLTMHNKIILIFKNNLNVGILDDKSNTFKPETLIIFENKDVLPKWIYEIKEYGIQFFESNFKEIYKGTKNYIAFIKSKNEETDKEMKNKNLIDPSCSKDNEEINIFEIDISKNKQKIKLKQKQEKEKKKLQSLKNVLSVMIDSEIVKRKMSKSLKESKQEEYYLLKYEWFKKYIKSNQLEEIFDYLVQNKIVESYLNNEIEENILENDININEIILDLENVLNKINGEGVSFSHFSNKDSYKADFDYITISKNEFLTYYKDFILISSKTKNLLSDEFHLYTKFKMESFPLYFGDDKIFIMNEDNNKKNIEIGHLNDKNIFQPTMFFKYKNTVDLKSNCQLLISAGFIDYQKYYLLFSEDYISPIFDQNNNRIGQAFRYDENISNYSKYISSEEYMRSLTGLYFTNYKLKTKFNKKNISKELYFIINENYLKEMGNYSLIENELNKIDLSNEINEVINSSYNGNGFDKLLEGKKISIIIKKILSNNENNLNNKNDFNESDVPLLLPFNSNNIELFYFDNFRLIDQTLYEKLQENKILLFKNINENMVKSFIIDTYILIDISTYIKSQYGYILEICELNNDNIIKPVYILAYDDEDYFKKHLKYISKTLQFTFKAFLESLNYSQNWIKLELEEGFEVGIIFKLSGIFSNQIQIPNQIINQNINNNISININTNNNMNPNINITVSNNPCFVSNTSDNNNMNMNKRFQSAISPSISSIKQEFLSPPLFGLKNVGATCYMNATLQCFCNLEKFVDYFKYKLKDEKIKNLGKPNLTISFKYLIENLWQTKGNKYIINKFNKANSNNKYYIPILFKKKISEMNPLFDGVQANDAKDLVNFLIMTLHEELNKAKKNKELSSTDVFINQSNRELVFNNFAQTFMKENMSLISDLFYAINNNVTECLNCHNRKYNFQIYFFLIFPLEEVRKFKIQNQANIYNPNNQNMMYLNQMQFNQNFFFQNNNQNINSVNLIDCFRYSQKIDEFSGENAMYCNNCQCQYNSKYQTTLYSGPGILIIILNRGQGIQFKVKCEFALQLNLYEFIENKETGFMYDLVGVVTHLGGNDSSGHFIAYCKNPINQTWYQYNDDLVFPVGNFVEEVINYAMPYILFYQKTNLNN